MADTGNLYREIGALKAAESERTEYYARIIREQAKRIAELEVDNQRWREYNQQLYKANRKKHAALKKLGNAKRERGKALVEERARRLHEDNGSLRCDHYGSSECGEAWQNFCGFEGCPHQKDFVRLAREQLRREGKL